MFKCISLFVAGSLLFISCKDETIDYSIKRPAALSLPQIKKEDSDDANNTASLKPITVEEAVTRSGEVFEGNTISIDSSNYKSANSMTVYLFNVKVTKRWKGNFAEGSSVAFMSRSLTVSDIKQESVFFLMPVDSLNVFASGNKLHWQWTFNAPQNLKANDSVKTLLTKALAKEP